MSEYLNLIKAAIVVALLAGLVWGAHLYNQHQQKIGYDRAVAEYKEKENEARDNAAKVEADLRKQLADAISAASRRNKRVDEATASASAANGSLRDAIESLRNSVPSATASTLANSVNTLSSVLGDCSSRYVGMAEKADRHASDAQTLRDGWPRYDKIK